MTEPNVDARVAARETEAPIRPYTAEEMALSEAHRAVNVLATAVRATRDAELAALVEAVRHLSVVDAERVRHDVDGQRLHSTHLTEAWARVNDTLLPFLEEAHR